MRNHAKSLEEKKVFVKRELPSLLLSELYKDCRQSSRELGSKYGVSYHTIAKLWDALDRQYGLAYTLSIDEQKLGFSIGKVLSIKFKERRPSAEDLVKTVVGSVYVQNAYLSNGDFDLLLYVIGLSPESFCAWLIALEAQLSGYGVEVKVSDRENFSFGFFPLRNDMIELSPVLAPQEKTVLKLLNENSRMKLKDIIKRSKMTQMQVVYTINKLKKEGIIKSFSALTQNPDKHHFIAYLWSMGWYRENHVDRYLNFWKTVLNEDFHTVTSDYCVEVDMHGAYHQLYVCTFKDGESIAKRGPDLRQKCYALEEPSVKYASLIDVLVGKWPFHLDRYENIAINVKAYEKEPQKYPFGGTWDAYMKGINLQRILNESRRRKAQPV